MVTSRKRQSGFISLSLGFALLALFGTISVGIEATHEENGQKQAQQLTYQH